MGQAGARPAEKSYRPCPSVAVAAPAGPPADTHVDVRHRVIRRHDRHRLAVTRAGRPAAVIGRRRRRQRPIGRRNDLQPAVAGALVVLREEARHGRGRIAGQERPVDHRRRHEPRPIEAEFAFDDAPGRIDAVDMTGTPALPGITISGSRCANAGDTVTASSKAAQRRRISTRRPTDLGRVRRRPRQLV